MSTKWNDTQPTYRQLETQLKGLSIERHVEQYSALPSAGLIALEFTFSPNIVSKPHGTNLKNG
jgi:DNA-binding transcriptional regulator YhcF (GntR family)